MEKAHVAAGGPYCVICVAAPNVWALLLSFVRRRLNFWALLRCVARRRLKLKLYYRITGSPGFFHV